MRIIDRIAIAATAMVLVAAPFWAQKIETIDGVRIVHNGKIGAWGETQRVQIELIRTIGGTDEGDANLSFQEIYDVDCDSAENIYIVDTSANHIQKLDAQGKFVKTIGRPGQGPGEFQGIMSIDIDSRDLIHILDPYNRRLQILDTTGHVLRISKISSFSFPYFRCLPGDKIVKTVKMPFPDAVSKKTRLNPLLEILDSRGRSTVSFMEAQNYEDAITNIEGNFFIYDVDDEGCILVAFMNQNRIEKYSSEGKLLWRADRELNFSTDVLRKGSMSRNRTSMSVSPPVMNMVSMGVAVDRHHRTWVNTWNRQLKPEEQSSQIIVAGTSRTVRSERTGRMDINKLEIFGPDGILLGAIPLGHLAHGLRICGDMLFVWERDEGTLYQYRIIDVES